MTGASRSQGIDSATCLMLAEAGADIFFTHWKAYDESEGVGLEKGYPNDLRDKIRKIGVRCGHMEDDLSKPEMSTNILNQVQ